MRNMSKWTESSRSRYCFECNSRGDWVSLPYGISLCLNCTGFHRCLGVHLSFVKHCNLDGWKEEQEIFMHLGGKENMLKHMGRPDLQGDGLEARRRYYDSEPAKAYKNLLKEQMTATMNFKNAVRSNSLSDVQLHLNTLTLWGLQISKLAPDSIFDACHCHNYSIIETLIKHGAPLTNTKLYDNERTLLGIACGYSRIDLVQLLYQSGAVFYESAGNGTLPLEECNSSFLKKLLITLSWDQSRFIFLGGSDKDSYFSLLSKDLIIYIWRLFTSDFRKYLETPPPLEK